MSSTDPLAALAAELESFCAFGRPTQMFALQTQAGEVPVFVNEFWTARQRAAHSLHEISYRACFKPQLPRFFIERLTQPGDVVHDPFMGRGTTPLEAALMGRIPWGSDANPLAEALAAPRLRPPRVEEVAERLRAVPWHDHEEFPEDLLVFYHPETLRELCALKKYLWRPELDPVDAWIRMVALNRLTGHSAGFFSVYTLPPNQAVSVESQRKINARLGQVPPRRHVPVLILQKTRQLLSGLQDGERQRLWDLSHHAKITTALASSTPSLPASTARLTVTSPPFLNVVQYQKDNWLRCWFAGVEPKDIALSTSSSVAHWAWEMRAALAELRRVTVCGGFAAVEVGEVRGGRLRLEEVMIPAAAEAGWRPELVLIHDQKFTKTSQCWGIGNNLHGTNTHRIVLLRKPPEPSQPHPGPTESS